MKIRFIDSHYNELCKVEDGGTIKILTKNGDTLERTVKYLDETHFSTSGTCYHICQFAEALERNGSKLITN